MGLLLMACQGGGSETDAEAVASPRTDATSIRQSETRATDVFLQVRAVLSPDGTDVRHKHPLRWVRRTHPARVPLLDGALLLRLHFDEGEPTEISFDAYEEDDSSPGQRTFGGFTLEVLVDDERMLTQVEVAAREGEVLVKWPRDEIPDR